MLKQLILFVFVLSGEAGVLAAEQPKENKPPNIIFVLADDMGYGDVSCYNPNSKIKTPYIDQLAEEGIRFTDAHSGGSSCIPSRYALMTGRFAVRKPMGLSKGPLIEEGRMTIASMLHEQGYSTAMVGKWHLGFDPFLQNEKAPVDYSATLRGGPLDCGFDSFFGMHASLDLPPYFYIRGRKAANPPSAEIPANSSVDHRDGWNQIQGAFWRSGKIAPGLKLEQVTPRFFHEAVKVIENHKRRSQTQPLFLYLALPSPHTPWLPSKEFQGKSRAGMYGDFVQQVDAGIGRVLETLKDQEMHQNTLVIFSSDNGPVWYEKDFERFGHDAVGGLRGMKFSSWEGGHRMPFLVRWPDKIDHGKTCRQPVSFSDVLATLADVTNANPVPPKMAEDSVSFLPYLLDPDKPVSQRPPIIHNQRTIRDGDWKLILAKKDARKPEDASDELYNLDSDLSERVNLISTRPEIAEKLKAELSKFKDKISH